MPSPETFALSLFPLQTVLFPEGLLSLKVFEARYLDLVGSCLREGKPFGVVALKQGSEVRQGTDKVAFEKLGTLAELIDVDSPQPGILHVRCRGGQRFDVKTSSQQPDGLWVAEAAHVPEDEITPPDQAMYETVRGLANAIARLKSQGAEPFLAPYRFDSASWVANRWCELLPVPLALKQRLMELQNPLVRLELVGDVLERTGIAE